MRVDHGIRVLGNSRNIASRLYLWAIVAPDVVKCPLYPIHYLFGAEHSTEMQ